MGVGRPPDQAFCHLRPSPGVPGIGAPWMDWPPAPRTALAAQPTPAGCAGLIVCRGGALPSPRRSASPPHPLFSPPLAPSSSSSPPAPSCSQSAVPTHSLAPFGERCLFRAR
ncbi:unnamed protein product [Rangifer tarandus platyrhynchus]|uniref:Uncharacterized protein n=1 Tax=Rangifer tarandus platyrhynchus TaxID=3082113 RepID=A0AC59Z323_RANTA